MFFRCHTWVKGQIMFNKNDKDLKLLLIAIKENMEVLNERLFKLEFTFRESMLQLDMELEDME